MKQRLILLCSLLATLFVLTGCSDSAANEDVCESICGNNRCSAVPDRICEDNCEDFLEDINCSRAARDYFDSLDDNNCDWDGECRRAREDWVDCAL